MTQFKPGGEIVATQNTQTYGGIDIAKGAELTVGESFYYPGSAYARGLARGGHILAVEQPASPGVNALVNPDHFMHRADTISAEK